MTSTNTPSGIITTNSRSFGYPSLSKLFDKDLFTDWYSDIPFPIWICYDFGINNKKIIKQWSLYPSTTYENNLSSFPKNIKLQASNDKETWVDLDTQVIENKNTYSWWESSILSNSTPYQYYRIYSTSNQGFINGISLGEVKLNLLSSGTTQTSTVTTASTTILPNYFEDAIPKMTSTNTPSGIITTNSRTYSNSKLYYLFDKNLMTVWYTDSSSPWWICYDFGLGNSKIIKKWSMYPSLYNEYVGSLFPKEVKLQASNDKEIWVDLDYQTNLIDPLNNWWESGILTNNVSYRYYRVYIISSVVGWGVQLNQIKLFTGSFITTTASTTESQSSTTLTTLSSSTNTTTTYTTTGTTLVYTSTTSWTTTTESFTTITPIPRLLNVTIDGTASAHGYLSNYTPDNAFDNDSSTFWLCSPYDNPPYWLMYHWTDESYIVDYYKVYLTSGGRPRNWQFQGSNDNENWDILDEVLNEESEGLIERVISNTTSYSSYRLYITDVWSRYYGIRVNELQMYSGYYNNIPESQMHWIGYDFEQRILVQRYCMNVPDGSSFGEWKLQGSNDGIFWIDVDYQVQPDFVGWKCIDIVNNNLSFNRWRLVIMRWSRFSNPSLVELELFQRG